MKPPLTIIKTGGSVLDDDRLLKKFIVDFSGIPGKKILVHGGGKIASDLAKKLAIPQEIIDGRRVTSAETLKVITMVYAGFINKNLVAMLNAAGCPALGISGVDLLLLPAVKRNSTGMDFGFVGDLDEDSIPAGQWRSLLDTSETLVVAPVTSDRHGQLLNTNADTIASVLARALNELFDVQLVFCFERNGVLLDPQNEDTLLKELNTLLYEHMIVSGSIHSGMIPKLDNAFSAKKAGVKKVVIGHAVDLADLIEEKNGKGTVIHAC